MATITTQFEQMAAMIAERTAEILCTRVLVIDGRGSIIASSVPGLLGMPFASVQAEMAPGYLRIPLPMGEIAAELMGAELIAAEPAHEALSPRLARVLIELMVNQTIVFARLPNQHELKNRFIHTLLRGTISDEAETMREGQILGMDLTQPRAVILVNAADYILANDDACSTERGEAQIRRRAQLVIAQIVNFFNLPNDTICAHIGNGEVAILKASSTKDLIAWSDDGAEPEQFVPSWANLTALKRAGASLLRRLRQDTRTSVSIGIGRYHPGIRGLARSYQDALAALSLGSHFTGPNHVHCLDGLGIAAFVGISDQRTKIDLAMHLLSPLDHEPELIETLDAFFAANCSITTTVGALCIHRNTLGYRLDKITALTGLDPRRFDDAVQVRLALLLRSLRGNRPQTPTAA